MELNNIEKSKKPAKVLFVSIVLSVIVLLIGTFGTAGPAVKIIPLLFIIAAACSPYQRSVQYLDLANRVAAIPPFIQYAWLLAVASSDSTASAAR